MALLIVLLVVGTLLEPLPRACLGSIIMVALISMMKPVLEVKNLWHVSLIDAVSKLLKLQWDEEFRGNICLIQSIFLVTLVATLLLDVDLGLAVAVLYSLLVLAFRLQSAKIVTSDAERPSKHIQVITA